MDLKLSRGRARSRLEVEKEITRVLEHVRLRKVQISEDLKPIAIEII